MRKTKRYAIIWMTVLLLFVQSLLGMELEVHSNNKIMRELVTAKAEQTELGRVTETIEKGCNFEIATVPNPICDSIGGEWTVIALARCDKLPESIRQNYLMNLRAKLDETGGVLSTRKYTEYSRVILALSALNIDAGDVYGYPLLSKLSEYENVIWQGVNGSAYALIALDSRSYEIPTLSLGSFTKTTRDLLIGDLLSSQLADGGWNISGSSADSDMTAMVLTALAPYNTQREDVRLSVDRALTRLSEIQLETGGFSSGGAENVESVAQVLVALSSLAIDPSDTRFVKNNRTVVDNLLEYQNADGSFSHIKGGGANLMATDQALYALVAYERFLKGNSSLFNMNDVKTDAPLLHPTMTLEEFLSQVSQISDTPSLDQEEMIQKLLLEVKEQGEFAGKNACITKLNAGNTYITNTKKALAELDQKIWNLIDPLRVSMKDAETIDTLMREYQKLAEANKKYLKYASDLLKADGIVQKLKLGIWSKEYLENAKQTQSDMTYEGSFSKNVTYTVSLKASQLVNANDCNVTVHKNIDTKVSIPQKATAFAIGTSGNLPGKCKVQIKGLVKDGKYKLYFIKGKKAQFLQNVKVSQKEFSMQTDAAGVYYLEIDDSQQKNDSDQKTETNSKNDSNNSSNNGSNNNSNNGNGNGSNNSADYSGNEVDSNTNGNSEGTQNQDGLNSESKNTNQTTKSAGKSQISGKGPQSVSNANGSKKVLTTKDVSKTNEKHSADRLGMNKSSNDVRDNKESDNQDEQVTYLENGRQRFSKDDLKQIKGRDYNLFYECKTEDGAVYEYKTVINGLDIIKTMDMNMGLRFAVDARTKISEYANNAFCFETLQEQLPGKFFISLSVPLEDGEYLLCRLSEEEGGIYYLDKVSVQDGKAQMIIDKAGILFLTDSVLQECILNPQQAGIISMQAEKLSNRVDSASSVKTGKEELIEMLQTMPQLFAGLVVGLLLAIAGIGLIIYQKRN